LGVEYLKRYDFAQVKPDPENEPVIDDPTANSLALKAAGTLPPPALDDAYSASEGSLNALGAHLEDMMGDAPVCDGCGHITVRNGACYKCLNCGNSMGCS
jgi:ribonucleoside-diphosphate reductase alpha chain